MGYNPARKFWNSPIRAGARIRIRPEWFPREILLDVPDTVPEVLAPSFQILPGQPAGFPARPGPRTYPTG